MEHTSRAYEERRLEETKAFAVRRGETAARDLAVLEASIAEMLTQYTHDNMDLYNELVVAHDRRDACAALLTHCRRAETSPYFGRVDFSENGQPARELYIGRGGLYDEEASKPVVIDWRTPVANLYYEAELGEAAYVSQDTVYPGVLQLKRTYSITNGVLGDYYDADLISNDELLQAYLAKNADAVLRDIVATIQKDQNEIIRIAPRCDVIVQGVAGSGKTTVAMHRLAFLIFNYAREMKPEQYAVIGANRMFLSYVSGMLPDLGVEQVTQLTMPELLSAYLGRKEPCGPLRAATAPRRSSSAFFYALRDHLDALEKDILYHELRLGDKLLMGEAELRERVLGGMKKPLLAKAELLNEWLPERIRAAKAVIEARLEGDCDAAVAAFKRGETGAYPSVAAIIDGKYARLKALAAEAKALKNIYIKKIKGLRDARIYADFLAALGLKASGVPDVYDLAALAYIAFRLRPMEDSFRHLVVDEAQDFGPMLYLCLTEIYPRATFTVLGDLSQNIGQDVGVTDWDEVLETAFSGRERRFCVLSKSYRNTIEIAEAANRVLPRAGGKIYRSVPVVRHGEPVAFSRFKKQTELEDAAVAEAVAWNTGSLALICPDAASARRLHSRLPGAGLLLAGEDAAYRGGVTVFDAAAVKGLEFDRVLVCGASGYPKTPRGVRLLYVVLTRALHSLRILELENGESLL